MPTKKAPGVPAPEASETTGVPLLILPPQLGSSSHQSPSGAGSSFTGSLAGCSGIGQQQQSHSRSRSRSR